MFVNPFTKQQLQELNQYIGISLDDCNFPIDVAVTHILDWIQTNHGFAPLAMTRGLMFVKLANTLPAWVYQIATCCYLSNTNLPQLEEYKKAVYRAILCDLVAIAEGRKSSATKDFYLALPEK